MSDFGSCRDSGDNKHVNPRYDSDQLATHIPAAKGEETTGSKHLHQDLLNSVDSWKYIAMDQNVDSIRKGNTIAESTGNKRNEQFETGEECLTGDGASASPVEATDMTRHLSGDISITDAIEASPSACSMEEFETGVAVSDGVNAELPGLGEHDPESDCPDDFETGPSSPLQGRSEMELLYASSFEGKLTDAFPQLNDPQGSAELSEDVDGACSSNTYLSRTQWEGSHKEDLAMDSHSMDYASKGEMMATVEDDPYHPYTGGLRLDQLDDDALYLIASFLEARVVRYALSRVCQRFKVMFDGEAYWKMRITVRWPKRYPPVPCPPGFRWVDACVEREDSNRVWSDTATNTHHFMYGHNVYGEVDAVHLMKDGQLLVSGDRNRILNFIDLSKYCGADTSEAQMKEMLIHTNRTVHQGWIWSITSLRNQVITGSWDTWIRMFDVNAGCQVVSSFKCKSAVLSLYADENEIVASSFDKKVYFMDHRTAAVRSRIFHTKPVLCVTGNDNFIISGSEDKSISIYDRRAGKIFMMFKLDSYPLCMSYKDNQLWFGDRSGRLHLHDGSEGVFQHVDSYDVGHTEKMTGLIYTRGAIFTCSGDRTVKVLHPTREPDTIANFSVHKKEIANVDYNSGVLVSAGGDDCIGVWLPKYWERDTYLL